VSRVNGADRDSRRDVRFPDAREAHDVMPTNSKLRCGTRGMRCTGRSWTSSAS
jgi:hypothetical protein